MKDYLQKILVFLKGILKKLFELLKEIIYAEELKPARETNTKEEK